MNTRKMPAALHWDLTLARMPRTPARRDPLPRPLSFLTPICPGPVCPCPRLPLALVCGRDTSPASAQTCTTGQVTSPGPRVFHLQNGENKRSLMTLCRKRTSPFSGSMSRGEGRPWGTSPGPTPPLAHSSRGRCYIWKDGEGCTAPVLSGPACRPAPHTDGTGSGPRKSVRSPSFARGWGDIGQPDLSHA